MSHIPLISNKTKLLISITLLLFAFAIFYINPNEIDKRFCLIAMLFSFFGDVALNCVPIQKRHRLLLYIGAVFFMIAHLLYANAFYWLISINNNPFFNPGTVFAAFFIILLFSCTIFFTIYSKSKPKAMTIFIFILYTIVIGINFVTIYSYSWSFTSITFIGALSFLISDFIIGIETIFKVKSEVLRKLVWIFYPIGQFLILLCR